MTLTDYGQASTYHLNSHINYKNKLIVKMGEETRIPNKNSDNNKAKESSNENSPDNLDLSDLDINELDISTEEFESLNNQLDALSSALDDIESKNDNIHAQLLELLQANRLIRQQIRDANLSLGGIETDEA